MLKLKTDLLKKVISNNYKLSEFANPNIEITKYFEIIVKEGKLIIKSTDKLNNLMTITDIEDKEADLRTAIDASLFYNLINKTTTEYVELNIVNNSLNVVGNGVYEIPIRLDDNGEEAIKLPEVSYDVNKANKEISFKELSSKISICKTSMPVTLDEPYLNNYYLGDVIIATNCFKLTAVPNLETMKEDSIFISEFMGKYLSSLNFEKCKFYVEENNIYFIGEDFVLSGVCDEDLIRQYPLDAAKAILSDKFTSNAMIKRSSLSELLDRLMLFVDPYDRNIININFTKDKMIITSKKNNGSENIEYTKANTNDLVEFNCKVDIVSLKSQIDSLNSEEIELHFGGNDRLISIKDGDITHILALEEE